MKANDILESSIGMRLIRSRTRRTAKTHNELAHSTVIAGASYSPWLSDEKFRRVYDVAKKYTLVDVFRCYELYVLASQLQDIEGDVLEVGVWRGGTAAAIKLGLMQSPAPREFFIADTFKGVVKASDKDSRYVGGEHADTDVSIVESLFKNLDLPLPTILQGIFPDDHPDAVKGKIAFLHCDVDVYESTKDIIDWALPRLSRNAIIVFDDYGFPTCEGVTNYCNELRKTTDMTFMHNLNGHAIFINNGKSAQNE